MRQGNLLDVPWRCSIWLGVLLLQGPFSNRASSQEVTDPGIVESNDSLSIRMVDTELRLAVQALVRYLDRPVVFGAIGNQPVTLEVPRPVSRETVPAIIDGMLAGFGLEMVDEGGIYRIVPLTPEQAPQPVVPQVGPVQLFVVQVRHARAEDVAGTVNALFGVAAAFGEEASQRPTLDQALNAPTPEPGSTPARELVTGAVAQLTGDVSIVPDSRTNSLLVRASQRDFELIRAAVEQLDVRPRQVLIEVLIVEVREDASRGLGLETLLPEQNLGESTGGSISGAIRGGGGLGDLVLRVMEFGGRDLSLVLGAAASSGDVEIVSRPVVLAANNERAEILVGSQRPFVEVQRTLPTEGAARDQVVQFRDVGTRLSVTPTISADGYVMLQVAQEVNAATAEVAFDAPVISTRTIQTQLLVRDGHTAVLGGLTDRQYDIARQGVPILSSIPLLGALFGSQVQRETKTELYVFLTPRVIRTDADLDAVSEGAGEKTRRLRRSRGFGGDDKTTSSRVRFQRSVERARRSGLAVPLAPSPLITRPAEPAPDLR